MSWKRIWTIGGLALTAAAWLFDFPRKQLSQIQWSEAVDSFLADDVSQGYMIATFGVIAVSPILWSWFGPAIFPHVRYGKRYPDFEAEHDQLRETRTEYWDLNKAAFRDWRILAQDDAPIFSLEDLLESAEFPMDLPLPMGGNMSEWAATVPLLWSGPSRRLWDYAISIYPTNANENTALLDKASFDRLHNHQGELSNFWHKAGGWIFDTNELKKESMLHGRYFPSQCRLLKLVTYLEGALALRLNTPGLGKQHLYRLYRLVQDEKICD